MSGRRPRHRRGERTHDRACLVAALAARDAPLALLAADQQGQPNIGGVMFLPYLRILPMHLTIILGVAAGYTGGVMLFAGLKMLADVLMHWIEYRITLPTVESPA